MSLKRNPFALIMGAAVSACGGIVVHSLAGLAIVKSGGLGLLLGAGAALLYQRRQQVKEDIWEGEEGSGGKSGNTL
ncbi:MAG: hypothetical protein P8X75_00630 [Limibacillus sp.]|jgi:hypothetical protein